MNELDKELLVYKNNSSEVRWLWLLKKQT
jgi:hypothetical protein